MCIRWTLTTELETIYLTIYPQVNVRLSSHHGIQKSALESWSYEMLINDTDNRCNSHSSNNAVNLSPPYKLHVIASIFTLLLFYSVKPAVVSGRKISPVSCHFKLSRRERFSNIFHMSTHLLWSNTSFPGTRGSPKPSSLSCNRLFLHGVQYGLIIK